MKVIKRTIVAYSIIATIAATVIIGYKISSSSKFPIENVDTAIVSMEVEFNDREMYLNIYLNRPLTCEQVIQTVGIQSFMVKNTDYVPSCEIVNTNLIKITYTQKETS